MVRVSPLTRGETDLDLEAVMPSAPFAVILPRTLGGASVQHLSAKLAVREALSGLDDGVTRIIAMADTAVALLGMASFRECSTRLIGLGWDAESLRDDIGAEAHREAMGTVGGPFRLPRELTLLGAAAAGVMAIDAAYRGGDAEALRTEALAARRDGFSAKFALEPNQAPIINKVFAAGG
jgi:citrate lyase subunit beta/citryl-CoA lyase